VQEDAKMCRAMTVLLAILMFAGITFGGDVLELNPCGENAYGFSPNLASSTTGNTTRVRFLGWNIPPENSGVKTPNLRNFCLVITPCSGVAPRNYVSGKFGAKIKLRLIQPGSGSEVKNVEVIFTPTASARMDEEETARWTWMTHINLIPSPPR